MVVLVVEEMGDEQVRRVRFQLAFVVPIADRAGQKPFGEGGREGFDAPVLGHASGVEFAEILVQDRVQPGRPGLAAAEPGEPDPVADHDVIQRAVDRLEESPSVTLALGVGQFCACRIERSEEHTSELQSLMRSSYAVFCLKKKKQTN